MSYKAPTYLLIEVTASSAYIQGLIGRSNRLRGLTKEQFDILFEKNLEAK